MDFSNFDYVTFCLLLGNSTYTSKLNGGFMSIYTDDGYLNRKDYLNSLADDYGIDRQTVYSLASILGSNDDFDGLITSLEDILDNLENFGE
jgi:hypothetical protein